MQYIARSCDIKILEAITIIEGLSCIPKLTPWRIKVESHCLEATKLLNNEFANPTKIEFFIKEAKKLLQALEKSLFVILFVVTMV